MVEIGVLQDVEQGPAAARLGAGRTDHDPVDPGLDDGPRAHLAGLQRTVERTALQPPVADLFAGLADAGDLGVGQRRLVRVAAVVAAGDDLAIIDDHGPDRDLPDGDRLLRLLEGSLHVFEVFRGEGGSFFGYICGCAGRIGRGRIGCGSINSGRTDSGKTSRSRIDCERSGARHTACGVFVHENLGFDQCLGLVTNESMHLACLIFRYLRQKASPYPGTVTYSSLISENHSAQSA